jgi:hypothetical protein
MAAAIDSENEGILFVKSSPFAARIHAYLLASNKWHCPAGLEKGGNSLPNDAA